MKKITSALLLASLITVGFVACDKNTVVVDKEIVAPAFSKFNTLQNGDTIRPYYVTAANTPYKIPVGITNTSNVDRTIQLTYTSRTAVAGSQFNAPATIVIPAGKAVDSLAVTGLFSGYPSPTRVDTVKIEITGGDVPANAYKNRFYLVMRKYCDVTLPGIAGDYNNTYEGTYGPYTSSVINLVSSGATKATGTITNVYDSGITANNVVFDWTDPGNFTVTIPEQNTGLVSSGYQVWLRTAAGTGNTFSSCLSTISLKIDLIAKTSSGTVAGYFAQNYVISMAR